MSPGAPDISKDGGKLLIVERTHRRHEKFALQAIQHDPREQVFTSEHPLGISQWCSKPRHAAAVGLVTLRTIGQESLAATFEGDKADSRLCGDAIDQCREADR